MKTIHRIRTYNAPAELAFDLLDDLGVTGMHMPSSSMPMMDSKMQVTFLKENKRGLNTSYRWTGKVMWLTLDFTVLVTENIGIFSGRLVLQVVFEQYASRHQAAN